MHKPVDRKRNDENVMNSLKRDAAAVGTGVALQESNIHNPNIFFIHLFRICEHMLTNIYIYI